MFQALKRVRGQLAGGVRHGLFVAAVFQALKRERGLGAEAAVYFASMGGHLFQAL